ncbi:MAG TPA: hypothetical protein VGN16_25130 [Acidobacteriaceae bacterium]|jgi:hypothetical protein
MKHYRSSIPAAAEEQIVSTHASNGSKQQVNLVFEGEVVGSRWFDREGLMASETPLKNGKAHGTLYYFDDEMDGPLRVTFAEPYRNGLAHGTAKQWSAYDGRLLGTYTMKHGTGLDLWRVETCGGSSAYLAEARYHRDGKWHGFEWWLQEDQTSVHKENHFSENLQHGIVREWNAAGRLRRGYPQYWFKGEKVSQKQYLRACTRDASLPPFHTSDNLPQRSFPAEVLAAIAETGSRK